MQGKVMFFNPQKGFGFIRGFRETFFFHIANFYGDKYPQKGQFVDFDVRPGQKGGYPKAIKIVPVLVQPYPGGAV